MAEQSNRQEESIQMQIIQAAQQLLQQHGLQKVTMDDVAREIGKRRSSLYYYYKSKEEILDAVIDVDIQEILEELNQAIDKAPNVEQKIAAYFTTRLQISQKKRMLNHMLDSNLNADELQDYKKLKTAKHTRFREKEIPLMQNILNFGISNGQLRTINLQEQDDLITLLLSSAQGFKKEMLLKQSIEPVVPGITMLAKLIVQALRP